MSGSRAQRARRLLSPRATLQGLDRRLAARSTDLFDAAWYVQTYPDVRRSRMAPLKHFRRIGWRLGYDPHPLFDTDWYLARYPEVEASGMDPLAHFMVYGLVGERDPNPLFNSSWYLREYPDIAARRLNPVLHYLSRGEAEGRFRGLLDQWLSREPMAGPDPAWQGRLVTIVIPIHGEWLYTERCLRALAASEAAELADVVVVDDRSPDNSLQGLRRYPWVKVLRLQENVGYTRAVNIGAADIETPFTLLLNNDTEPQPGFLYAMLDRVGRDPSIGIVGSRLVYGDGQLQEAGSTLWEDASGFNYGKFEEADDHAYTFSREVDYCSAASILLRTDLWRELGGFDERYSPAYYEDSDLAFGVRGLGMKVVYDHRSVVVHHEGKSHGTELAQGLKRHQVVNQGKFRDKWKSELTDHARDGEFPRAVCSVRTRPRIMFVVSEHPIAPHRDSGSRRMGEIFTIWEAQGFRVTVFGPRQDPNSEDAALLRASGVEFVAEPEEATAFLEANRDWVAAIWYSHATSAYHWRDVLEPSAAGTPSILDTVDLHHLRELGQAEVNRSPLGALRAQTSELQEFWAMAETDATVVVSETELAYLHQRAPDTPVYLISNIHPEVAGEMAGFPERKGLLFIGSFAHLPNPDGVAWFLDEVWPLLPPEVQADGFDVVGGPRPAEIEARDVANVRIHGWVPEVTPYLASARLSIAPLRFGGGVKGKVGEAWTHGLPVIGTSVAMDGMADKAHYPMADQPGALAELIAQAYLDSDEWERLRKLGLQEVNSRFSTTHAARVLGELQTAIDAERDLGEEWRPRADGRIRPWDLPGWAGSQKEATEGALHDVAADLRQA